eukprot:398756_1
MYFQHFICLITLISFTHASAARRIVPIVVQPVDFNKSTSIMQTSMRQSTYSQIINTNKILSDITEKHEQKQNKTKIRDEITQRLCASQDEMACDYQQQICEMKRESQQIQEILLTQKATMRVIKHIEKCFYQCFSNSSEPKGKVLTVNGKDIQKLINLIRKDEYGMQNTTITVDERA